MILKPRKEPFPLGTIKIKNRPLAFGEVTGHRHEIIEGEFEIFQDNSGNLFLRVLSGQVVLRHGTIEQITRQKKELKYDYPKEDNHEPETIPKNDYGYDILFQQDYAPKGWSRVTD